MKKTNSEKELLQQAVDFVALYGGIGKAVKETQIPTEVLGARHAEAIRRGLVPSTGILEAVARTKAENETPKAEEGTRDEVIQDIIRVYEAEGQKITQKTYERFGQYPQAVWAAHFNDWNNFLRFAGIRPHRDAMKANADLAKLVEASVYVNDNVIRQELDKKYERPSGKGVITFMAMSDLHDNMCDPFFRRVVLSTAAMIRPDLIVMHGDIYDMYPFSSYQKDPKWDNVEPGFQWCRDFFRDLRLVCPQAQIDLLEGNHEFRLWKAFHAFPMFRALVGGWMKKSIPDILGLDEFQINYVGKSSLALPNRENYKLTVHERNSKVYYNAFKADHYGMTKSRPSSYPGFNGHHHKYHAIELRSDRYGPSNWIQTGCGHVLRNDYASAENWSMGFLTGRVEKANYDHPRTVFEHWNVHDTAHIHGQWFERDWVGEFVETDHVNKFKKP